MLQQPVVALLDGRQIMAPGVAMALRIQIRGIVFRDKAIRGRVSILSDFVLNLVVQDISHLTADNVLA